MFDNLGWQEIFALLLVALFILGPERLPKMLRDIMNGLRKLRQMARNATADLSDQLGTDVQLEDLNPKTFLRKHVLSEEDEAMLRRPLDGLYSDMEDVAKGADTDLRSALDPNEGSDSAGATKPNGHKRAKFDADAT
ncbi:MAG: preprotein translocase subunit TatB [Micromonosporaceae bacterium]|nr:preprotein translocase subunit TatB [Micromonosporaceae bacterium]